MCDLGMDVPIELAIDPFAQFWLLCAYIHKVMIAPLKRQGGHQLVIGAAVHVSHASCYSL